MNAGAAGRRVEHLPSIHVNDDENLSGVVVGGSEPWYRLHSTKGGGSSNK